MESYVSSKVTPSSLYLIESKEGIVGAFLMYDEFCDCSGGFACWITDCYLNSKLVAQERL